MTTSEEVVPTLQCHYKASKQPHPTLSLGTKLATKHEGHGENELSSLLLRCFYSSFYKGLLTVTQVVQGSLTQILMRASTLTSELQSLISISKTYCHTKGIVHRMSPESLPALIKGH